MKKLHAIILLILLSSALYAQKIHVVDQEGRGVPYAAITWDGGKKGLYADSLGYIQLPEYLTGSDSITCFAVGYSVLRSTRGELVPWVQLERYSVAIDPIVVHPRKSTRLGYANKRTNGIEVFFNKPGAVALVNIANPDSLQGQITKILVTFHRPLALGAKIRLYLLQYFNGTERPHDLLPRPLIVECTKRKMEVDVSEFNIPFTPEGIAVAMQTIAFAPDGRQPLLGTTRSMKQPNSYVGTPTGEIELFDIMKNAPKAVQFIVGRYMNFALGIEVQ
jgi:hypothetical protein